MIKHKAVSKDAIEFASRLKGGGGLATALNRILCDQGVVKRLKQYGETDKGFWRLNWYSCSDMAAQAEIDFLLLTECMRNQQARRWRGLGDKSWNFLVSIHPCVAQTVHRELYICIHCERVYADEPVSQCDCLKGTGHDFVKSSCEYVLTEP